MTSFDVSKATAYLVSLLDEDKDICFEDNGTYSGRYWTASDNMLAFKAFDLVQDSTRRDQIYNSLSAVEIECSCGTHNASMNHHHDVIVWGNNTEIYDPPRVSNCWLIDTETTRWTHSTTTCPPGTTTTGVFHEDHCTGDSMTSYDSTAIGCGAADLCFLEAINYKNKGNSGKAEALYDIGHDKWDGNGYNDRAHAINRVSETPYNKYDTFKIALDMIASWRVNAEEPENFNTLDGKIAAQQDGTTGGVHSTYIAAQNQIGSANCETTALAIIAYKRLGY